MKKKERLIPVGTKIFWGQTVMGILWIGAGLTGMFDNLDQHNSSRHEKQYF